MRHKVLSAANSLRDVRDDVSNGGPSAGYYCATYLLFAGKNGRARSLAEVIKIARSFADTSISH